MKISKEISLTLAVLIMLVGGGYFVDSILGKPSSPEIIAKTALANSFTIDSKTTETTAKIGLNGGGAIDLSLAGNITNASALLPTADYQLQLAGNLTLGNQPITAQGELDLRIVDEALYFRVLNPVISGDAVAQTYLTSIAGKWLSLPLKKLSEENTNIAAVVEGKQQAQQNLRAKLQTILTNNLVFTVKESSGSLISQKYYITIIPQLEGFLSDDLVGNLAELLGFGAAADSSAKLKAILGQLHPEIKLTISRSTNALLGYATTLQLDTTGLATSLPAGATTITLENKSSNLNQPVTITPPEDSDIFDAETFEKTFPSNP